MSNAQPPLSQEDRAVLRRFAAILGWALLGASLLVAVFVLPEQLSRPGPIWQGVGMMLFSFAGGLHLLRWSRAK